MVCLRLTYPLESPQSAIRRVWPKAMSTAALGSSRLVLLVLRLTSGSTSLSHHRSSIEAIWHVAWVQRRLRWIPRKGGYLRWLLLLLRLLLLRLLLLLWLLLWLIVSMLLLLHPKATTATAAAAPPPFSKAANATATEYTWAWAGWGWGTTSTHDVTSGCGVDDDVIRPQPGHALHFL